MTTKVAVVTGANRGIGLAIVRGLCKQFNGDVILTARSSISGQGAVKLLEGEGLQPIFYELDITEESSIVALRNYLVETYGGLDVLVNNAAVAFGPQATESFADRASVTMRTNFTATMHTCKLLFPILRSGARVVLVSSEASTMALTKCCPELQQKLRSSKTLSEVEDHMGDFVEAAKAGDTVAAGWPKDPLYQSLCWPNSDYGVPKLGLTVVTPILQKELEGDLSRHDLVVNCCCPGDVSTDMTGNQGEKTPDEGAETPLYLALLPHNVTSPKGNYVREKLVENWIDPEYKYVSQFI